MNSFIEEMVAKHDFEQDKLAGLFKQVEIKDDIIKRISKPSESLPWYKYRKIFLNEPRIKGGVAFWAQYADTLATVEQQTGVPPAIIVAIIGVETLYGKNTGHFRVIDALSTLAFNYPPRSQFFRGELEHYLLLCREEHADPLSFTGSYAGAMGMPQFMPSSFRNYAVDFNKDNKRNIWQDPNDVIASVANYFEKHLWQPGQPVASLKQAAPTVKMHESSEKFNGTLTKAGVESAPTLEITPLPSTTKAKNIVFEQELGKETWAAFDNFFVITRYNRSPLYAMAVYQLSLAISKQRATSSHEKTHPVTTNPGAL